jgi:uncharacterized protein (DUF1697 family)
MAELRSLLESLGFKSVRTLLQSGNAVFESESRDAAAIEAELERETEARLGVRTDYLIRTAAEWRDVIAANPFQTEAEHDPGHVVVMQLKAAPEAAAIEALRAAIAGPERVEVAGREAYIVYPAGIGRSKLTNALIESKLGTRGTGRNWNTALKLAEMTAS